MFMAAKKYKPSNRVNHALYCNQGNNRSFNTHRTASRTDRVTSFEVIAPHVAMSPQHRRFRTTLMLPCLSTGVGLMIEI